MTMLVSQDTQFDPDMDSIKSYKSWRSYNLGIGMCHKLFQTTMIYAQPSLRKVYRFSEHNGVLATPSDTVPLRAGKSMIGLLSEIFS
ncbi:S2-RNase [Pyrus ussuriensis x Pyrus communis]|uniref:S2-RNase n=1 Tax=Pyrus ussuriensis x Pyrus communis TaxID=2448454 RepID=A0A5N5EZ54_9ROSA|nr:S2-RNase [Pyrus ussuriensis x Pyrus communis]